MIRCFEERDKQKVIRLWQEAFGESERDILPFLEFINSDMLLLEEEGEIISMLSLLKVKIGDKDGRYVYAVATDRRFRGKGYASVLINHAKAVVNKTDGGFLVILPRNEALYSFYAKFGFVPLHCAKRISRRISAKNLFETEKITAEEYAELKKTYFSGEKYVLWDIKTLRFMKKAYSGEFLKASQKGEVKGFAFCHKMGDKLMIHELIATVDAPLITDSFGLFLGAKSAECIKAERCGESFGMIYPPDNEFVCFGLGMQ